MKGASAPEARRRFAAMLFAYGRDAAADPPYPNSSNDWYTVLSILFVPL
jgi:hypothetical protein